MKRKTWMQKLVAAALILLGILADQGTKRLAIRYLKPTDTVPLWKNVLHLTYVENPGAAFGMLANHRWVFMIISTAAILGIGGYLFAKRKLGWLECIALSMIVSGGIGNMIDRTLVGYVVDFVDFRLINFAVFNTADALTCVGAGLLVLAILLPAKGGGKSDEAAV